MRRSTILWLARPASVPDRVRLGLVALSVAAAGALLIVAAQIARLPAEQYVNGFVTDDGLAPYVAEPGLRPGSILATVLLCVPVLALAQQALRVGSVARDRRLAALRLAGATPRDVRAVAIVEAGGAAMAGGVLAGPGALLLWLLLGVLPPSGLRLVAAPDALDLPVWLGVILLAGLTGAVAGVAVQARVVTEPLGVRRRGRASGLGRRSLAALLFGLGLLLTGLFLLRDDDGDAAIFLAVMPGVLLSALAGGPRLVRACSTRLVRREGARNLLAGRRLEAEPQGPGRVAGVLAICGIALGLDVGLIVEVSAEQDDLSFYLGGAGLAGAAILVAAAVAVLTLLVGAADQLLDGRRPLAALAALGTDEAELARVLARQLSTAAVPAIALGVFVGGLGGVLLGFSAPITVATRLALTLVTASLAAGAVWLVARLVVRLLRRALGTAIAPENLRVA
jgi:hypothetical protein